MHTMQTCGLLLQMQRGLRVCLCAYAGHNSEPYKNGWTVDSDGPKEPCIRWGRRTRQGKGQFWGSFLPLKCGTLLCKQQMPQQHRAADLSAGDSASRWKCGFRMDSPATGVTSAGAMRPFVKILWPLVTTAVTADRSPNNWTTQSYKQTYTTNCKGELWNAKPQQAKCLTLQKNWANSHSYDKHHWTTPHYSTALRHNTDYSFLPARHYASTVYEQWPSVCVSLTQVKSCIEMSEWIELVFGKGFPSIYSTVLQGNSSVYKNKGTSLWNFHSFMHIHTLKVDILYSN